MKFQSINPTIEDVTGEFEVSDSKPPYFVVDVYEQELPI